MDSFSSIHKDTSTGYLSLTTKTGDVISIKNIEKLLVNNIDYGDPSSNNPSSLQNVTGLFYVDSVRVNGAKVANFFSTDEAGGSNSQNLNYAKQLWPNSTDVIFRGTEKAENLNLTFSHNHEDRSSLGMGSAASKNFILDLKGGNDVVSGYQPINTDTVNLGSGDDTLSLKIGGNGTTDRPNYSTLDVSTLDGGVGSDWIIFTNDGKLNTDQTLRLNTGGATNFENLGGSSANEILYGDNEDNIIAGGGLSSGPASGAAPTSGGTDSVYGLNGNDTLYANGKLYGGAGNDKLIAFTNEDILDGGKGADTLTGGNGADTFVLRAGDGGSTKVNADTITDFKDGTDVLGLDDGLKYTDLTITQSGNDTVITKGPEYLAILEGFDVADLTEADFTPVDIA